MATEKKSVPVTIIKKLGTQAPTFELPVKLQKLDGTAAEVKLHCKAMRKTEWAELRDENQRKNAEALLRMADDTASPVQEGQSAEEARKTALESAYAAIKERGHEFNVRDGLSRTSALVMKFATGWELEDPFTAANLEALDDEFGGFFASAMREYDQAIYQGKLGNFV